MIIIGMFQPYIFDNQLVVANTEAQPDSVLINVQGLGSLQRKKGIGISFNVVKRFCKMFAAKNVST